MSEPPPPTYNAFAADAPVPRGTIINDPHLQPPEYTPPTFFVIGSTTTPEPLVRISEIKGHLSLLHRFAELKKHVEAKVVDVPNVPQDLEKKWIWFVGLAVERFDTWCRALKTEDLHLASHIVLPPLDVMMVWHAYMLNPRWYAEDCMRIPACTTLKKFNKHFKHFLRNTSLLPPKPSRPQVEFWRSKTNLGFDPLEEMGNVNSKAVACPKCKKSITVDFMKPDGTGYFQQNFKTACLKQNCGLKEITKETLILSKLVNDLATKGTAGYVEPSSRLAGTLHTPTPFDLEKGMKVKKLVCDGVPKETLGPYVFGSPTYYRQLYFALMDLNQYTMGTMRGRMGFSLQPRIVGRILSAYNDDRIYSVELVGAVLRQGSFVSKMYDLGWTAPKFFDKPADELALQHAMARYHAFLDLMSSSPASFFVPTLDIDLVWHTHQLLPEKYENDCTTHLQRFIDHDDKVESIRLSSAFDITCRAWKERFHVEYTHCGCPVPGDTIGQRLSRMVGMYSKAPPPSHLVPFDRPDLLSSTHPSDHNSVHFMPKTESAHKIMTRRYENLAKKKQKERERAAKKAKKAGEAAALAPGAAVVRGRFARYEHDMAFLVPVPIFFGGAALAAGAIGGCVVDGNTVGSVGGCSSVSPLSGFASISVCSLIPLSPVDMYSVEAVVDVVLGGVGVGLEEDAEREVGVETEAGVEAEAEADVVVVVVVAVGAAVVDAEGDAEGDERFPYL